VSDVMWKNLREKKLLVTCFMTCSLGSGSKVKSLSDCQLWQVCVCLSDVCSCPLRDELLESVPIVGDFTMHLQGHNNAEGMG